MAVTTAAARLQLVDDSVSVTGSVSAWDPLSVGAEVNGLRIQSVAVEEGDFVRKGQPLARLNSALLTAQLKQARARLAASEATLRKSIQPNRREEILALAAALAQAEANVAQGEAQLKQARVNLKNAEVNDRRYAELLRVGAVSNQDAETKQVAADTAQQDVRGSEAKLTAARFMVEQAREKLLVAQRGGRAEDVDISRAAIAETRAQVQQLEDEIQQTVIRAPDDGLISGRNAHIGDITAAGRPLFSMIRRNRLELRAQVCDLDLPRFKAGQPVRISTREDEPGKVVGKVMLVSPQVDPTTRLGTVRIALPANAGLKPGMFVRGQVLLGHRQALVVPVSSLVTRNGASFVFTLDGRRAVSRPVKVGAPGDDVVEVTSGLSPGEPVVAAGARFLSDNDTVRVGDQ